MPLYNLLNKIEHAHQTSAPTMVNFWDMRRAFDSIPRNLQRLAWQRLGVPQDTAEWFVSLDEGGQAFVDTPLFKHQRTFRTAADIRRSRTPDLLQSKATDTDPLFFIPLQWIGQGESASSLMWVAVYDILLE